MEVKITVQENKTRLDKAICLAFKNATRNQVQQDILKNKVKVNDKIINSPSAVVRLDDEIVYDFLKKEKEEIKALNRPIKIVYENEDLLIVDKPFGLVVYEGAGFKGESLVSFLLFHYPEIKMVGEEDRPGIVHRLDKDTSGLILIAKNQPMYEHLKEAFSERKIKKEYITLVVGEVKNRFFEINSPLGKSLRDFRKMTVESKDSKELKTARTGVVVERVFEMSDDLGFDKLTLLAVKLYTGRTHQIRVHLSSIGFPILGDELYGGKKALRFGAKRQMLHAKKIEVKLLDGTWIEVESDVPEDFKKIIGNY